MSEQPQSVPAGATKVEGSQGESAHHSSSSLKLESGTVSILIERLNDDARYCRTVGALQQRAGRTTEAERLGLFERDFRDAAAQLTTLQAANRLQPIGATAPNRPEPMRVQIVRWARENDITCTLGQLEALAERLETEQAEAYLTTLQAERDNVSRASQPSDALQRQDLRAHGGEGSER